MSTESLPSGEYNGHESWQHWNVSLWINNDDGLYRMARDLARSAVYQHDAAQSFIDTMAEYGQSQTPDGAPYSVETVAAAMVGMDE